MDWIIYTWRIYEMMGDKTFIRVYGTQPINMGLGDEKISIKIFTTKAKAGVYFTKLVKRTRKDAKDTDDVIGVQMEDINTGAIIKYKYFNQ